MPETPRSSTYGCSSPRSKAQQVNLNRFAYSLPLLPVLLHPVSSSFCSAVGKAALLLALPLYNPPLTVYSQSVPIAGPDLQFCALPSAARAASGNISLAAQQFIFPNAVQLPGATSTARGGGREAGVERSDVDAATP